MRIILGGYWDPYRAKRYQQETVELGKIIAERGHDVVMGPGSGVVKYFLEGFNTVNEKGKIIYYIPSNKELIKSGEKLDEFADEVIETEGHYIERMYEIAKAGEAYVAIGGGAGALYEMINMMFLKKPVAVMTDTGTASIAARFLGGLRDYYFEGNTPQELIDYLEQAKIKTNIPSEGVDWYDEES